MHSDSFRLPRVAVSTHSQLPADWPVELRFLALCLREALGAATDGGANPPECQIDWALWLAWVDRHKVSGFLHRRLPQTVRATLPAPVAAMLRERGLHAAHRALARAGELTRLAAEFEERGIRVLALKGSLLSQQLYGEAGLRHAGDIDLLVAPSDVAAADLLLREAGYRRSYPDFELTAFQWRRFLGVEHELNHFNPQTGIMVELQWRLEGLPYVAFDDLWRSRSPVILAGRTVPALPADVSALFLFAHGAKHGWSSLFWLVDAALFLRDCSPEKAEALWEGARRMAVTKALLQGAALARELLAVELPGVLATHLERRKHLRGLVAEAARRMRSSIPPQGGERSLIRDTMYLIRLQESWRARFGLVRRWMLSPQNWKEFPLPDNLFWLYYPMSPPLWAWRRFRTGRQAVRENPPRASPRNP